MQTDSNNSASITQNFNSNDNTASVNQSGTLQSATITQQNNTTGQNRWNDATILQSGGSYGSRVEAFDSAMLSPKTKFDEAVGRRARVAGDPEIGTIVGGTE